MPEAASPPLIQGTPGEVRDRLTAQILVVRSLWFPSPRDLRGWDNAISPVYLRWLGEAEVEVVHYAMFSGLV